MKKIILSLSLFVATTMLAVAQKADSVPAQAKTKGVKATVVNGAAMLANKDIVQNVSAVKDYSILFNAIKAASLTDTFESKGPITIFAPTNAAFAKLPTGKLDTLMLPVNKFELSTFITYHAVAGKWSARDLAKNIRDHKGSAKLTTLAGSQIVASIDTNRNIVLTDENGGQCIISQFDIEQSNGMLHVVNSVFVPKSKTI